MTKDQLAEHQARFEQQFAKANNLSSADAVKLQRHGENYGPMSHWNAAWQGYQLAVADVAMAAPVGDAQPVAWMHETPGRVDVIHDEVKKLLSSAASDYLHRPVDKSEKYTIPLYAAAQPVEVQRVAWIERWHGSPSEQGWSVWQGREMVAHLGTSDAAGDVATKLVQAHNATILAAAQPAEVQLPTMEDAVAAGDGALHQQIDKLQAILCLKWDAALLAQPTQPPTAECANWFKKGFEAAKRPGLVADTDPHGLEPVEMQRVPLTYAEADALVKRWNTAQEDDIYLVRMTEIAHGIKPTDQGQVK